MKPYCGNNCSKVLIIVCCYYNKYNKMWESNRNMPKKVEEQQGNSTRVRKNRKTAPTKIENKRKKYINISIVVLFIVVVSYAGYDMYQSKINQKLYAEAKPLVIETQTQEVVSLEELKAAVKNLEEENQEVVGWIQIPETIVDYPLLQSKDNDYYLRRNYKKEYSKYGSIFMNYKSDLNDKSSNGIIYGHNMSDGQMFATLNEYSEKTFYDEHDFLYIATVDEVYKYEIFSVFNSKVYEEKETGVFRYYNYIDFNDEKVFNEYIDNVKKEQLYDTGREPIYGQQLITLSTCRPGANNNRIVVVAQMVE